MVLVRQASVHYDESAIYPQLLIDFSHNNTKLGFTCSIWDIVGLEHSIVNAFFSSYNRTKEHHKKTVDTLDKILSTFCEISVNVPEISVDND